MRAGRNIKRWLWRVAPVVGAAAGLAWWYAGSIMNMPGRSYSGPLPPLSAEETEVRDNLRRHVETFAAEIGPRNILRPQAMKRAAETLTTTLHALGYAPALQTVSIAGVRHDTVEAELKGTAHPGEILIIGAHYDTVGRDVPGANDNGSGIAAALEIARLLGARPLDRTVRFVFFHNEEGTSPGPSGSRLYARRCRERGENIIGMFSLETMGYYTDAPQSQKYPPPFNFFYPSTGNFIFFVGTYDTRAFTYRAVAAFRKHARFPSRGAAAPDFVKDAARSDHTWFGHEGYPGIMVTDTANFRYRHYHTRQDTPDKLNYDATARVTVGLARAVQELAS